MSVRKTGQPKDFSFLHFHVSQLYAALSRDVNKDSRLKDKDKDQGFEFKDRNQGLSIAGIYQAKQIISRVWVVA